MPAVGPSAEKGRGGHSAVMNSHIEFVTLVHEALRAAAGLLKDVLKDEANARGIQWTGSLPSVDRRCPRMIRL